MSDKKEPNTPDSDKADKKDSTTERREIPDRRQREPKRDERGNIHAADYVGPDRRSGLDRRKEHERRQRERIRKAKMVFVERTLVTFAILFLIIVPIGVFLLAPEYMEIQEKAKKAEDLEKRVQDMNQRLAELQKQKQAAEAAAKTSLSARINSGISKIEESTKNVKDKVTGTVDRANSLMKQGNNTLLMLMNGIHGINQTPEGRAAFSQAMGSLKSSVLSAGGDETVTDAVEKATQQDPALKEMMKDVDRNDMAAAALLLALTEFRQSVGRGTPYEEDLQVIRRLVGDDPEMNRALDSLEPYAASGMISSNALEKEFGGMAGDIVMAKLSGEDVSVKQQALARMQNLVKVRKVDELEGNSPDAIVARAQIMLENNDVQGAITELNKLEGAPAQEAEPFIEKAKKHLAAKQGTDELTARLLRKMSAGGGAGNISLEGLMTLIDPTGRLTGRQVVPYMSPVLQQQKQSSPNSGASFHFGQER